MEEKELINFVNWLIKNQESLKGASFEETVSWINDLSTSKEGKQILSQLINTYKESNTGLFKKGGKLHQLLCFKSGGKGPGCGCNKKVEKNQLGGVAEAELPRYAKIVETRSPYAAERTLYYSNTDGDYDVKDGRIVSIEEGVPIAIAHNEIVRAGKPFGLNLPEINEFREPWYGVYREQPDGMNFEPAFNIDQKKAAKETAEKIKKIRSRK